MIRSVLLLGATLLLCGCSTWFSAPRPAPAADAATDAAPLFDQAAQSDLYLGVVDGLIRQHRYEAAIAFLAKYQKAGAATPRFKILAGDALTGAGRYDEAIASYRGALTSDRSAAALNGIGLAESARGNWATAVMNFRQASLSDPTNAEYLNNMGYALLKQDPRDAGLAVGALERAHELDPDAGRIRNNLALATARAGQQTQLLTLLNTIPDGTQRKLVADFAVNWNPAWNQDASVKGNAP